MKQELINAFFLKTKGILRSEDMIKLERLLQTTSDETFPILMMHKVRGSQLRALIFALLITAFSSLSLIILEGLYYFNWHFSIILFFLSFAICSFCVTDKDYYREYSKIALAYQIKPNE